MTDRCRHNVCLTLNSRAISPIWATAVPGKHFAQSILYQHVMGQIHHVTADDSVGRFGS